MTDRPIIFNAAMVRALLAGRKTQTRRVLKPQPYDSVSGFQKVFKDKPYFEALDSEGKPISCAFQKGRNFCEPYPPIKIATGDRLWVRENCRAVELRSGYDGVEYMADGLWEGIENTTQAANKWGAMFHYGATGPTARSGQTVPSIHMPRWASRLTLAVTDVRVQRLQDISEADAVAEGIEHDTETGGWWGSQANGVGGATPRFTTAALAFRDLWNSINGPDAWGANPWVAAYTFTVERSNIDGVAA